MDVVNEQGRTFSNSAAAAGATPGSISGDSSSGMSGAARDPRSLGELLKELSSESGTLVSQEIALAKAELTEKGTKLGMDLAWVAAGALLGVVAAMVGVYCWIQLLAWIFHKAGLSPNMSTFLSAAITALALATGAWYLINNGLKRLKTDNLKPRKTVETLQETKEWMKEKLA